MDTAQTEYIPPKKNFWERHYRQIIYTCAFLCVLLGTLQEEPLQLNVSMATQGLYDTVDMVPGMRQERIDTATREIAELRKKLQEPGNNRQRLDNEIFELEEHLARLKLNTNGILLLCMDFDPGTSPELQPMADAIMRHCFQEKVKVLGNVGYNPVSAQLGKNIMDAAAAQGGEMYAPQIDGEDYLFLGFRPNAMMVFLQMGEDIITAYETDYAGNDLNRLPIMRGIKTFDEIEMVVTLTGYVGGPEMWINVAKTKFNKPVGIGMTAVSAADYYPYIQSGQIVGLLSGLRGAAEYETSIDNPSVAVKRMRPQLYAHTFAIFLIVVGNIEFFVGKFKKRYKR
jgi:hypothetical protein